MTSDSELPKPLSVEHTQRLAFVRYLLQVGIDQSRRPEPFGCVSLLTFHDVVEMFLQIVAEHFGASQKRAPDFLEYWTLLESVGVKLPQREPMRRFNSARVNLKHRGVRPAHAEIEGFRASAIDFLSENSRNLFGVDFERISLTDLVKSEKVRNSLKNAEAALNQSDWENALGEAKVAFVYAMREYQARPRATPERWRGFSLGNAFHAPFIASDLETALGRRGRELIRAIERMSEIFGEAITIVAYNLDFEGYLVFKTHTPVAHEFVGGKVTIEWMASPTADSEIVARCVAFAIDTAIRLESTEQVNR